MFELDASRTPALYVPRTTPRVIVAGDGRFAAVVERGRVTVLELAGTTVATKYSVADDAQIAWLGMPSRLLIVSPGSGYQTAQLIDPEAEAGAAGSEARIESSMRIAATTGAHALLIGERAVMLLHAKAASLAPSQFPTRLIPTVAGPAGPRFVVALEGSVEEWDAERRAATRRVRLRMPTNNPLVALGGGERQFWMMAKESRSRIDVIVHVNRGQPTAHELPEPIATVVAHPQRELIACIGDSGKLYVAGLDGQLPAHIVDVGGPVSSVAFCAGHTIAMVIARVGAPVTVVGLDGKPIANSSRRSPFAPESEPDHVPLPVANPEVAEPTPGASEPAPPPIVESAPPIVESAPPAVREAVIAEAPRLIARVDDDSAYPPMVTPQPWSVQRAARSLPALGARAAAPRCSKGEWLALLDHFRRAISARVVRAIARDWDSGRLAFPTHDRPPHEAEVLGIAGRTNGLHPDRLAAASDVLEQATQALSEARARLGERLSPLDLLCREHAIDRTGELVLLHVVAPALWGELARLYGILANDVGRAVCDEHLLVQLLGEVASRREIARALDPDSPLVRHGLVRLGERPRPFQFVVADPIIVKLLGGYDVGDDEPGIDRVDSDVPLESFVAPKPVIERGLAELEAAPPGLGRVVVRGRSGSGRRTLLAALAKLAGRSLAMIDIGPLIRDKRVTALSMLLQHANLRGWLPCVDGLDAIPSDDSATRGLVRELIRAHHGPLAVRLPHHMQPPLDPDHVMIELPTLSVDERAKFWQVALGAHSLHVDDADALAARFVVGPGTIRRVAGIAARTTTGNTDTAVEDAMRQHLETKLGAVATRVTRLASWSQVVLPSEISDSIVELVARIRHRRKVFDTWGFDKMMSTSRGITALFQGGPGTGKTLVAGAIANELGLDLYRIDLSRVMSKWIGETEQNLGKVFDAAEEGQAVILFDEADSLFAKRTEVRTSVDRYANLEVNYLLQRLDSFEGVAILTTNFGTAIDSAFKRRMTIRLTFPFPDEEARARLWRVHLPSQLPVRGDLDLDGLARRFQMSGGYIRNAALRAAFLAAEESSPLTRELLERAVLAEFREGGKLAESGVLE